MGCVAAIAVWTQTGDVDHAWIIGSYFHYSVPGGWSAPQAKDISPAGGLFGEGTQCTLRMHTRRPEVSTESDVHFAGAARPQKQSSVDHTGHRLKALLSDVLHQMWGYVVIRCLP